MLAAPPPAPVVDAASAMRGARGLVRGLGLWSAASLVVGTIIGTGVFLKTAEMAAHGQSAG